MTGAYLKLRIGAFASRSGLKSIMLYDGVQGGAGHALQLSGTIDEILGKAFEIVLTCTYYKDTSCYECLCNYLNQTIQHNLSQGGAMCILGIAPN